ncbi:hypothetical protein ABHV46_11730 [Asaia sp. BMEF1]|uniref:hypothetical protein n=1 Tax=Asaia sp. BMEF1 TaxID=3155932 RepID=UPI003F67B343
MLVQAHRFITLNQRLGNASTLTPGDIVDLAAFYQAGFPGEKAQNAALRKVLRQMDLPVKEFACDLHRVKALYDLLKGPSGSTKPPKDTSSLPSLPRP